MNSLLNLSPKLLQPSERVEILAILQKLSAENGYFTYSRYRLMAAYALPTIAPGRGDVTVTVVCDRSPWDQADLLPNPPPPQTPVLGRHITFNFINTLTQGSAKGMLFGPPLFREDLIVNPGLEQTFDTYARGAGLSQLGLSLLLEGQHLYRAACERFDGPAASFKGLPEIQVLATMVDCLPLPGELKNEITIDEVYRSAVERFEQQPSYTSNAAAWAAIRQDLHRFNLLQVPFGGYQVARNARLIALENSKPLPAVPPEKVAKQVLVTDGTFRPEPQTLRARLVEHMLERSAAIKTAAQAAGAAIEDPEEFIL